MSLKGEEWFWHLLALKLGGRTVSELKTAMSVKEFFSWVEFYKLYPFDDANVFKKPTLLLYKILGGDITKAAEFLSDDFLEDEEIEEGGFSEVDKSFIKNMRGMS